MKSCDDELRLLLLDWYGNATKLAELTHTKPEYVQQVLTDIKKKTKCLPSDYFNQLAEFEPKHRDAVIIFKNVGISKAKHLTGGDRQVIAYLSTLAKASRN
jgi:hypothetical protein